MLRKIKKRPRKNPETSKIHPRYHSNCDQGRHSKSLLTNILNGEMRRGSTRFALSSSRLGSDIANISPWLAPTAISLSGQGLANSSSQSFRHIKITYNIITPVSAIVKDFLKVNVCRKDMFFILKGHFLLKMLTNASVYDKICRFEKDIIRRGEYIEHTDKPRKDSL